MLPLVSVTASTFEIASFDDVYDYCAGKVPTFISVSIFLTVISIWFLKSLIFASNSFSSTASGGKVSTFSKDPVEGSFLRSGVDSW